MSNWHNFNQPTEAHATLLDPEAFAELTRRCYGRVYFTALAVAGQAEMAEDIAQETFLRAWLKRDTVKPSAQLLQPWLIRIARNLAIDWLRTGQSRSRVLPLISLEEVTVEPADHNKPDPRQAAGQTERRGQLADAVMALPEDLRQVVLLHYAEGMTATDIARVNGEAPSSVTRRLEKARAQLRQQLESGLTAGIAVLKPRRRALENMLGILSAAVALPATSHAKLLQAVADTPPPPLVDPVALAAGAAPIEETGIMKSIIAKAGAAKLLGAVAVIVAVGGGVFAINNVAWDGKTDRVSAAKEVSASRIQNMSGTGRKVSPQLANRGSRDSVERNGAVSAALSGANGVTGRAERRASLTERIALLKSDLISTQPKVFAADSETSGHIDFNMQVVDGSGLPVEGATVKFWQIGYEEPYISGNIGVPDTTGTLYGYGFKISPGVTDKTGIARMSLPLYVQGDYLTKKFSVNTIHPDYTPTSADMELTSITKIVLTGGNTLNVMPVDEATSAPIVSSVEPVFDASFKPDWEQRADGTVAIRKISENQLPFYLKYVDGEGKLKLSGYQNINLPYEGEEPLRVPVEKGLTVRGTLSANVVRPVEGGRVIARNAAGPMCSKYAWQEVDVAEDGSFTLTDMPPGEVLIAALVDGYNSTEPAGEKNYSPHGIPHRFTLTSDYQEYVMPMEARCNLRLSLIDASGKPVPGATVSCNSMMCFDGCCEYWGGKFSAVSSADGIAEIVGVPAAQTSAISVAGGWRVQGQPDKFSGMPNHNINLKLQAGETIEKTLVVEPDPTRPMQPGSGGGGGGGMMRSSGE